MQMTDDFVPGPVCRFLAGDHRRLERLLEQATADPGAVDPVPYAEFRAGLLRHIGMEEKILLPAAQRARGGTPLPIAARLRLEHGAIAALLVPSPTPATVMALRAILSRHDAVEEGSDGVYATCERLMGDGAEALLAELRAAPAVPVAPHVEGTRVMAAVRRALARAGYDLADYETGTDVV
jgi:hypothetical protein